MSHRYLILGAGMQGTAAAYDLAKFANPEAVVLADMSLERAQMSAERVNGLTGAQICSARRVDVLDEASLADAFSTADVALSCVPYWMHPQIACAAIASGTNMCDLGGNTDVTWQTLALDKEARLRSISLIPDCGLAPGLVNSLAMYLIEQLDDCESVKLYCGVLPQHPRPPFNYKLTFNVEGLVTEYDYEAIALRDGEIVRLDTLAELEEIHIKELGSMEAFTTSGGTSTAAYTLQGRVSNYEYKTIRFPGHCERMKIFKDFGFWSEDPVDIKGSLVRPKDVFCRVFGKSLQQFADTDQCAVRAVASGTKDGRDQVLQVDLFDKQCEQTGFTSMERLTGFSISIYAQQVALGLAPKGCVRYELAVSGAKFVSELERRGIAPTLQRFAP